jgi:hypothetical protein
MCVGVGLTEWVHNLSDPEKIARYQQMAREQEQKMNIVGDFSDPDKVASYQQGLRHDPLFIGHYLAPWHAHWLAFEQWRMHRELPHSVDFQIAIDPTTAAIKATPSAEPASTASEKKPTRVRVSSEKRIQELIEEYIDPVTGKVPGRDALYSKFQERGLDVARERIDAVLRTKYKGQIRGRGRGKAI